MSHCPVCGEVANESNPDDCYEVDCGECGRFDVTGTARSMLKSRDLEARLDALKKAKRRSGGEIPVIDGRCFIT